MKVCTFWPVYSHFHSPHPDHHHSTVCFGFYIRVRLYSICLSVSGLFHLGLCPQGTSMLPQMARFSSTRANFVFQMNMCKTVEIRLVKKGCWVLLTGHHNAFPNNTPYKGVSLWWRLLNLLLLFGPTLPYRGLQQAGFPVLRCLPEFAQTHVCWVSDAIQPCQPLPPLSLLAFNLSHHQIYSSF